MDYRPWKGNCRCKKAIIIHIDMKVWSGGGALNGMYFTHKDGSIPCINFSNIEIGKPILRKHTRMP